MSKGKGEAIEMVGGAKPCLESSPHLGIIRTPGNRPHTWESSPHLGVVPTPGNRPGNHPHTCQRHLGAQTYHVPTRTQRPHRD